MRYRRFVQLMILCIALFVAANYIVWNVWTRDLLTERNYNGGDLARMGYCAGSKYPRTNHVDLPRRHLDIKDYKSGPVDLITIGDSFSKGGGSGRNYYYQDYIASLNDLRVMNMPTYTAAGENEEFSHITTVVRLANSGFLKKLGVRYLLLQSVERWCIQRFAGQFDFSATEDPSILQEFYARQVRNPKLPEGNFINNGNLKFIIHTLWYRLSDHDLKKRVYRRELNRELFSVDRSRTLLFLGEDFKHIPRADATTVAAANENLNRLADLLNTQGVRLIFMPCVDKYNLYREQIVNNPYPRSVFFEELRKLPKRYQFVDTKAILAEELSRGEKDIFYADDTHWSWKASKKIFETVRFE